MTALLVAMIFCVSFVYYGHGSVRQLQAVWRGDALYCESDHIDAGQVKWGTWAEVPISVRNISGDSVAIQGLFSQELYHVRPDLPIEIPPGEQITITLVTLAKALAADPKFTREVEIYLDSSESAQASLLVNVSGLIENAPEVEPNTCGACSKSGK
ncbi:MAG: hypothetical protein ACRC7O_13480 [Fimbriiglobus sp.]